MAMIQERQKEIDDMYSSAGAAEQNARAMEEEYKEKLSAAAQTSERIVKDAVARAHSREEEILRQANADAAAILDKASADIAQEKKKAINDAKNEISGLALAIAGKVVERELNEADQAKFIDSFIEGLGDAV
jgi:F-type H+-transporting ATPase subunit b